MGKQLAIRGHATRGNEVIEILEMLGGKNNCDSPADNLGLCYLIDDEFDICAHYFGYDDYEDGELNIFTLEEFLEKYPFKVGDKVVDCYGKPLTIKSMEWSEDCETMVYDFKDSVIVLAAEDLLKYNAKQSKMKNVLAELLEYIKTTPKEDLERDFEEIKEWSNVGPTVEEFRTFCECVNKKPKYPTTYAECCEILMGKTNFSEYTLAPIKYSHSTKFDNDVSPDAPHIELFNNLYKIFICRNAYWKIAGEKMGLGKPWKPDWNGHEFKYGLKFMGHRIEKTSEMTISHVLCFPTEEMRDAFYENFKELIEECRELL